MFPYILLTPPLTVLAHWGFPVISEELWKNLFVPMLLTFHLLKDDSHISTTSLATSLALYYCYDIATNQKLLRSMWFHHALTVVMIVGMLATSLYCKMYFDKEVYDLHMYICRLVLHSEISTIFLNLRPIADALEMPEMKKVVDWAFFVSFVWCRFGPAYTILRYYPFYYPRLLYYVFLGLNLYWCARFLIKKRVL